MPEEYFSFSKDMTHVRRMLKPSGPNAARALFDQYSSVMRGSFDAMGTGRYADALAQSRFTANSSSVDSVSPVPVGFVQYVFFAHVFHNDVAAHTLWLTIQSQDDQGANRVIKVCEHFNVVAGIPVELPRVIILPPRALLQGRSLDVLPVVVGLTLEYFFVNVPIGEYVVTP